MALSSQIVDFIWPYKGDNLDKRHRIAHVPVMKMEILMSFEMGYPFSEIHR